MTQNGTKKNGLNKLTLGPYPNSKKVYLKGNVFPEIQSNIVGSEMEMEESQKRN